MVKTGIFQKEGGSPVAWTVLAYVTLPLSPPTPRNISDENFWFIYGRIRQWKILAQSVMHQRAFVDVVRYVQNV